MKISGARVALGPSRAERLDICIRGGKITFGANSASPEPTIDLNGFLVLPGLINAHDHLEFNLFPQLGSGLYPNARAWADDIYRPADSPVREHLRLSKRARLLWGGIKNLLSGVTTVAHHNLVDDPHFDRDFPVKIVKQIGWAHSLDFSIDIAERFRATPESWPFLLHAAEGIDKRARSEIARLDAMGVLSDRTVLIHALGVDRDALDIVRQRGSGIVWCPSSNLSVYGCTLTERVLRSGVDIALGTDSAMTAQTDLIDEISVAGKSTPLSPEALYEMVTTNAARLLRLNDGRGKLSEGGAADLIAVEDFGHSPAEALPGMKPELVMVGGEIRAITPGMMKRTRRPAVRATHSLFLEGRGRWHVSAHTPALVQETAAVLGSDYRLAGRRISA